MGNYNKFNNNKKRGPKQQQNNQRQKKEIRTYTKQFDVFEDALSELLAISVTAAEIIGEGITTPDDASMQMFNYIANNYPTADNRRTLHNSINMSSTRCYVKTCNGVSFGWKLKYKYDRETATVSYNSIEMTIIDFNEDVDVLESANYYGWESEFGYAKN